MPLAARRWRLVSLIDMLPFYAHRFFVIAAQLRSAECVFYPPEEAVESGSESEQMARYTLVEILKPMLRPLKDVGFKGVEMEVRQLRAFLISKAPFDRAEARIRVQCLRDHIRNEMEQTLFFCVPAQKQEFYTRRQLFGPEVEKKFGKASGDIEEAGKCLAVGRYTACVFHLMRIMERGVQFLGTKMQVPLAGEKEWGTILNLVNGKLNQMTNAATGRLTPTKKARRDKYAAAVVHLTNVKNAWRNRVMHPKDSYLEEEAEEVFRFVRTYIRYLARAL